MIELCKCVAFILILWNEDFVDADGWQKQNQNI